MHIDACVYMYMYMCMYMQMYMCIYTYMYMYSNVYFGVGSVWQPVVLGSMTFGQRSSCNVAEGPGACQAKGQQHLLCSASLEVPKSLPRGSKVVPFWAVYYNP